MRDYRGRRTLEKHVQQNPEKELRQPQRAGSRTQHFFGRFDRWRHLRVAVAAVLIRRLVDF